MRSSSSSESACSSRSASSCTSSTCEAERLGEVQLEQPVVADHLERDALAGVGQLDAAVGLVLVRASSAASFFTIALADAIGDVLSRRASAVTVTSPSSACSL